MQLAKPISCLNLNFPDDTNPYAAASQVVLNCILLYGATQAASTKMADLAIELDFELSGLSYSFSSMFPIGYP